MKRYRRGKNRCKVCGWPLNDGNSHLHWAERFMKSQIAKVIKTILKRDPKAKLRVKKYGTYNSKMLKNLKPLLTFDEFGKIKELPQPTIQFKRYQDMPAPDVTISLDELKKKEEEVV